MKVTVTQTALMDMVEIGRWIQSSNSGRAESFVAELQERCIGLEHLPLAFPLVPGREQSGIRRRRYKEYLIFYRVKDDSIEILHILHGSRDYDRILFPED